MALVDDSQDDPSTQMQDDPSAEMEDDPSDETEDDTAVVVDNPKADLATKDESGEFKHPFSMDVDCLNVSFDDIVSAAKDSQIKLHRSERRPFFFYPNIFKGLSEPLHQLINNRRMAESQAGAAELPDEDPAVFAGFLRLAYEVASTPSKKLFNKTKQNTIVSEKSWLDGAKCPECTIKRPREASGLWLVPTCHKCGWKHPTSGFQRWCSRRWYTHEYYRVSKTAHPLDQDIPLYQEDDGEDMDIDEFEKQPSLQFCAQMYLFADKYLIRDMTVTSLRAFEERLQVYHRASWNSGVYCEFLPELFDMLDFLDSNMSETTYPLRRSLFRYVVSELPRLMQDKEFRELLASKSWIGFAISESVVEAMSVDHDLEL